MIKDPSNTAGASPIYSTLTGNNPQDFAQTDVLGNLEELEAHEGLEGVDGLAQDSSPSLASLPNTSNELSDIEKLFSKIHILNICVGILAVFTFFAALYLARAFFVPLLIGILASYALRPVVVWLQGCHIPSGFAAALVLISLVGSISWLAFSLREEAATMMETLPQAARKMRQHLSEKRSGSPTALQNFQEAANEIQAAATDAGIKPGAKPASSGRVISVRVAEPNSWLRDYVLAQTALLLTVAAQAPTVLLLTFFILASGTHFRRKLVGFVGPSLSRKKDALAILVEIDTQIQRYLLVMVVTNTLLGISTWLVFKALGVEQAGVWGVVAGVLHFIPYLGTVLLAVLSGIAAFLQFDSLLTALMVSGASLIVASAIGFLLTTWLQSRFAKVNIAVLFIALLFFGWLWGVWGLLLGAPIVAIAKVICDRVEPLKPIGNLLGQ